MVPLRPSRETVPLNPDRKKDRTWFIFEGAIYTTVFAVDVVGAPGENARGEVDIFCVGNTRRAED